MVTDLSSLNAKGCWFKSLVLKLGLEKQLEGPNKLMARLKVLFNLANVCFEEIDSVD